jgi:hypothetical protein
MITRNYFVFPISILMPLLLLFACKSEPKVPSNILSKDQMVPILIELHIAEKVVGNQRLPYDSSQMLYHSIYKKDVLDKRNIRLTQFDSSWVYYEKHLEDMMYIYDRVIDSLGKRISDQRIK